MFNIFFLQTETKKEAEILYKKREIKKNCINEEEKNIKREI